MDETTVRPAQPVVVLLISDDVTAKTVTTALDHAVPDAVIVRAASRDQVLELLERGVDMTVSELGTPDTGRLRDLHRTRLANPRTVFVQLTDGIETNADDAGLAALNVVLVPWTDPEIIGARLVEILLAQMADESGTAGYDLFVAGMQRLSLAPDLGEVMVAVRLAARQLTGADGAIFVLRDGEECYVVEGDAGEARWRGTRYPLTESLTGWAMLNRQPAVVPDMLTDPRIPIGYYDPAKARSMVAVPIRSVDPIGAICAYWANRPQIPVRDVKVLQALADTTAMAIENAQAHDHLEQLVKERTEELEAFTYAISHDLRAPIRHILGYAAMVGRRLPADPEIQTEIMPVLTRISTSANHMRSMVDGVLDLSRTSRSDLRRTRFDLAVMACEVATACTSVSSHAVRFEAPEHAWVDADPTLMRGVLQNLLDNAWKFTSMTPGARVWFLVESTDGGVPLYTVRDNGAGFEPSQVGRLFGVFARLHRQDEFPGTGVGLASVRQVIKRHGGVVWAEGSVTEGARFSFTLQGGMAEAEVTRG